jgi:hypothetical protein
MQERTRSARFLRLVEGTTETNVERDAGSLAEEADQIEALNGRNPYSSFLRKHVAVPIANKLPQSDE